MMPVSACGLGILCLASSKLITIMIMIVCGVAKSATYVPPIRGIIYGLATGKLI